MSAYFPEPRLSQMREHMTRFARSFGIEELGQPSHLSNTKRALAVAEYARDQGKLTEYRHAAMQAYWKGGNSLQTDDELRAVAVQAGLNGDAAVAAAEDPKYRERVAQLSEEGRRVGVSGIPTFFIGQFPVVGCQPYQTLAMVAERAGAKKRTAPPPQG